MYGQFIRDMPEGISKEKSRLWLRKCDLKIKNPRASRKHHRTCKTRNQVNNINQPVQQEERFEENESFAVFSPTRRQMKK